MTISLSALQRIKLGLMIGGHRCEDIKSMTDYADLFKIVRATTGDVDKFTLVAGNELMIKQDEAADAATVVELAVTSEQLALLKSFITGWKGGWVITDNDWVTDLLSKL